MRIFKNGERIMKNNNVDPLLVLSNSILFTKKFIFKKNKHQVFWANCVTIALFVLLSLAVSPSSTTTTSINENASAKSSRVVHKTIIKKVGTKELNKEKARTKILEQEQKNKQAEYNKLKQQLDDYQEKEEQKN